MKLLLTISAIFLLSCAKNSGEGSSILNEGKTKLSTKQLYLNLGGEKQYLEIISSSDENPILLFVHGGPAWPQTPQLRYFNSELAETYTVVIWEQRGAGKNFKKDSMPQNLSMEQIISDGLELSRWLRKEFIQEKIILAGYSWGSLVGINMVHRRPEYYSAYYGISQFINSDEGMRISQKWLREQAIKLDDSITIKQVDSLENINFFEDELDRFFHQYLLLNKYHGAVYQEKSLAEVEFAENMYEDYKEYDWYSAWEISSKILQKDFFGADVRNITQIEVPIVLFQGRHDWNVPSVMAKSWFDELNAPKKKFIWFEQSGHGPLEEEPGKFNQEVKGALNFIK